MAVQSRWQEFGATPGGFELMIPFAFACCVLFSLISMLRKPRGTNGRDKDGINPDPPKVDEKLLLRLSKETGRRWMELATELEFKSAEVDAFRHDHRDNLVEQCHAMLVAWRRKQASEEEARQGLLDALEKIGLMDLVELVEESATGNLVHDTAERCQRALKRLYTTTGSYVQMLPWVDDNKRHIMDIYTKLHMLMVKDDNTEDKVDSYGDIFRIKTKEGLLVNRVICEGQAGLGKTTLLDKIAYDWATGNDEVLKQFNLVFVLKFSALSQDSDLVDAIFDQLLPEDAGVNHTHLKRFIQNYPDQVLVLLDGFDEFTTTRIEGEFGTVLKLLNRKVGGECFVIVTTRPSHSATLKSKALIEKPFTSVQVLGFTDESVKRYVGTFYEGKKEQERGLLDRIKTSSLLRELVKSPMLLLLMCLLWNESSALPETISRLYSKGIQYMFRRRKSFNVLKDTIIKLGKVGFDGLISPVQRLTFREQEFDKDVLDIAINAGILTRQRVRKGIAVYDSIQFIHKTFQEYCAAKYCQYLIVNDTRRFHSNLVGCDLVAVEYLLRFCCSESVECTNAVLQLLVETQMNMLDKRRLGLACFYESQSKVLPPEEFLNLFFDKCLKMANYSGEATESFLYLLKVAIEQNSDMVERVEKLSCSNFGAYSLTSVQVEQLMSAMPNLSDLQLSFNEDLGGKGASWSGINEMKRLQKLTLSHCSLTGKDWKAMAVPLSRLPDLVEFDISGNTTLGGKGDSWSGLKELKRLQKLNMSICSMTDEDWISMAEPLKAMPDLAELDLSDNRLRRTVVVWSLLKEIKSLRKLTLRGCSLTIEDLKSMIEPPSGVHNLTELDLSHNWHLGGMGHSWSDMKELRHLRKLILCNCSLDGEDLISVVESLGTLPNLAELDISDNVNIGKAGKSWSHLMKMQQLENLKLSCCSLSAGDLENVAVPLSSMPSLTELNLSRNRHLGGMCGSWSELKEMKYLHKLILSHCSLAGVDLKGMAEPLSSMPNLTELDLSGNGRLHGMGASWSHLKKMNHIQELTLSNCSLTGEDLKAMSTSLCSLSNLSELDLSDNDGLGTAVKSWSYLKELNNLQKLTVF